MSLEAQRVYLTRKMEAKISDFAFPISLPNNPFNIPKNAPYGEFHIMAGPQPVIIGGEGKGKGRVRYVGMVQLTVFVPNEKGTKLGTVPGDLFESIFQLRTGRDTAMSTYKFGVMQSFTPDTKAGWMCFVYRVPFKRDAIKAVEIGA